MPKTVIKLTKKQPEFCSESDDSDELREDYQRGPGYKKKQTREERLQKARERARRWRANRVNMTEAQKLRLEQKKLTGRQLCDPQIYYENMMNAYDKIEEQQNKMTQLDKTNNQLNKRITKLSNKKERKNADTQLITHLYHTVLEY